MSICEVYIAQETDIFDAAEKIQAELGQTARTDAFTAMFGGDVNSFQIYYFRGLRDNVGLENELVIFEDYENPALLDSSGDTLQKSVAVFLLVACKVLHYA